MMVNNEKSMLVLSTFPSAEIADRIGRVLLEESRIACMTMLPGAHSVYRWQGKIETSIEVQAQFKTTRGALAALTVRLKELHPYEVPEIVAVAIVDGDDAYARWLVECTRASWPSEPSQER
jgi:periplasmic divalent cation tolerance protein